VKEHGIDFYSEGKTSIGDVLASADRDDEAHDDQSMVNHQLVCAALSVVQHHVQGVVDEVTDGHGHQHVRGVRVSVPDIFQHLGGMVKGYWRPYASDERVD
jgi:hypothetical protein